MTVKNQHRDYSLMLPKWQRCLDVSKGQDAVHAAGTAYLPRLGEQTDTEYNSYRNRAIFYNATWRTIVGLQGMVFRKPPHVKVPTLAEPMLKDVTLSGTSLHLFALEATEECLKLGRVGVLVDFPVVPATATLADAKDFNYRPSMRICCALSIVNWRTKVIKNATKLSMVVLREAVDIQGEDEFSITEEVRYRVLDLTPLEVITGEIIDVYRVRVFRVEEKSDKTTQDILMSTDFPRIEGKYLSEIPFQFIGVDDASWKIDEPPLIDLVDMNLSHYMSTADYEHGCHFTGLPTPVVSGYTPEPSEDGSTEKFCIGSMTAWVFPNANAKASYLEFTGQGLTSLKDNIAGKSAYMAILGARMLEAQSKNVESANTAAINRGGEQSMLSSVAQSISIGLQKALLTFCKFVDPKVVDTDVEFLLNKDFFAVSMSALDLTAIIAGWQNGAYSYETMFANLKKGEIVAQESLAKDELLAIAKNPAPLMLGNAAAPTTPGNQEINAPKPANTPATPAPTITQLQNT